jgi:hypothetical protein
VGERSVGAVTGASGALAAGGTALATELVHNTHAASPSTPDKPGHAWREICEGGRDMGKY